jgi:group I intron endonuclease
METKKYCIYIIKNINNNKVYIGQTIDPSTRKRQHFSLLSRQKHPNKHLQSSYNKYGKDSFIFEIIEIVENQTEMTIREGYWTEQYKKITQIYNQRICVDSNQGYKFGPPSDEKRKKLSEAHIKLGTKPPSRKGCKGYKLRKNQDNIKRKKVIKKLSLEAVEEIRKLYIEGNTTNKELSIMFNVHQRTIRDIINYKTHKE